MGFRTVKVRDDLRGRGWAAIAIGWN
jgi:hypothetical protein